MPRARPMLGAYYSIWYPTNSEQGTLRQHLIPSQGTDPSKVDSANPEVAARAIAQASAAGINFFAVQWSPARPAWDANFDAFVAAPNLDQIKFCVFYGTPDLATGPSGVTRVGTALDNRFNASLVYLAGRYFSNKSYLRIDGRPVVVLYLTRTLTGDVSEMIDGARTALEQSGFGDPFFIGDEIFWGVTAEHPPAVGSPFTQDPQYERIKLFDAITDYNLYGGGPSNPMIPQADFVGYAGQTKIVSDEVNLYRRYAAVDPAVPVLPDVMPGVNTRGVRLGVNQPAEPRQWLPGDGPASTLTAFLHQIAFPALDPRLPIIFITSWNEWNEDTAIQPVGGIPTAKDNSPDGHDYTQGYSYGGEDNADLDAIHAYTSNH